MTWIHDSLVLQPLGLLAVVAMGLCISWGTLLVSRLFRSRSAPFREMILKIGLCLMLGWPIVVLIGVAIGSATRPVPRVTVVDSASEATPSPSPGGRGERNRAVATSRKRETVGTVWTPVAEFVASAESTIQEVFTEPSPEPGMSYTLLSIPQIVVAAKITWSLGILISLGLLARDLYRVRKVRQRLVHCDHVVTISALKQVCQTLGLNRTPELQLSPDLTSPCTAGIRQPAIILPLRMLADDWDRDSLLGVLTHEAAHVKRRDVAWSLLVRLARAVYWWEFGLAIIDRQLSQLREEICDNHVLLAPVDRRVYAKTLLDFAEGWVTRPLVGVIGMMGKNNPLSKRIERMLAENAQPHTRMSGWSRTGLVCGGLVAVVTVGLLGVWAQRAGAVDPFIARANLQGRVWSDRTEAVPAPVLRDSAGVPGEGSAEAETVSSQPIRTRVDSSIPDLAQVRSGGKKPAIPSSVAGSFEDSEPSPFPLSQLPEPSPEQNLVPVTSMEPYTETLPSGASVVKYRSVVTMLPRSQVHPQSAISIHILDLPADPIWTPGQPVQLTVQLPAGQTNLPQLVTIDGLHAIDLKKLPQTRAAESDPIAEHGPEPLPTEQATLPPAPPATEPASSSNSQKVALTGPWQAVATAKWLLELGGVPTLAASSTSEAPQETPANSTSSVARYRLVCDATSDESGQLKGIVCFGRDLPIGEAGPVESFKSFVATWRHQCSSAPEPIKDFAPASFSHKPSNPNLQIILNVPDNMRYGDVQKIAMACDSEWVQVEVRSGSTPAAPAPLGKSYTSVELTRVYDKQGKPVGPGAILVAHKFGSQDQQIITDNHWNRALGDFARHHPQGANVLLVNADADLPLDLLRDLQVRANREGIEEVRFLTAAVPATLEVRGSDGLYPLIDDLPEPAPPMSDGFRNAPFDPAIQSTDLSPQVNTPPANGPHRGI